MIKVNTHGLKMVGLKKASGNTLNYKDKAKYDEIFYDRKTGEVWTVFQCSLGQNSWTRYHDGNVVKVCNTSDHMTMQEIADRIRERLEELSC